MHYDVMPLGELPLGKPTNRTEKTAAQKPAIKIRDGVYERDGKMFTDLPMPQAPVVAPEPDSDYGVDVALTGVLPLGVDLRPVPIDQSRGYSLAEVMAQAEEMMAKACGISPTMLAFDSNCGQDETAMCVYKRNVEREYVLEWAADQKTIETRRQDLTAKVTAMTHRFGKSVPMSILSLFNARRVSEVEPMYHAQLNMLLDNTAKTLEAAHRGAVPSPIAALGRPADRY